MAKGKDKVNSKNVSYGKPKVEGAVYYAPTSTDLPTDAVADLNEAFVNLGYISEDGLTNENSPESESIKAWGGDTVLTTVTDKPDTFSFTLIESKNINVLKYIYGSENVTGELATGIKVTANSKPVPECSLVIDMVLKDAIKRIVIPRASVSELGEISYADEDAIGYEVTINALPDEQANTHYEYIKTVGV